MSLSSEIKQKAQELGFAACGISKADELKDDKIKYTSWLKERNNADMAWMENNIDKRFNPSLLIENAQSVITVLLNYYPEVTQPKDVPQISKYAYGRDYHKVIKQKLFKLIDFLTLKAPNSASRAFVDSAPVAEHAWAQKSGLGWIGKHSLLINRKHGSFVFIGEIISTVQLEPDKKEQPNLCDSCTRCIDACPTNAIVKPYTVDANKCISYHTIENKNKTLPEELSGKFNNYIFGCDICQDVCPYNKNLPLSKVEQFKPSISILEMSMEEWNNLSEEKYHNIFNGTPVIRAKYEGLKRNLEFILEYEK